MIGIYKITSPSGRVYVGQSIDIDYRFNSYRLLRCKSQTKLYRSFIKYGFENHILEVVCECDEEDLNEKERYYQELYNCIDPKLGLNCVLTKTNDKKGRVSEETKQKLRYANIGKKLSPETIEKVRQIHLGKKLSKEHRDILIKSNTGRVVSEETRNKMRLNQIGKKQSKETIERRMAKSRGADHHSAILILNKQTGIYYETMKEAAQSVSHISYKNINRQLNGDRKIINNPFLKV